jgi:hypothetical protein
MTAPVNMTLYRLLVTMGASEPDAEAAARIDTTDLATKADLDEIIRREIAELKAELLKWGAGLFVAQVGVFSAIVGFLKVFG